VEPASRIGGIATNRLGAAMAGVKVFVFPACGSCSQAAARTGSNGIYSIPWDTHSKVGNDSFFLIARDAKRNLAGLADIEPDETNYDILLNRGLSIQGSVQDAEGHPLTNAVVTLAVWSGQGGDWFEEHNPPKLDTNGQFSFPALPRSRIYSIRATVRGYNQQDTSKIHGDTDTSTEIILPPLVLQRAEAKISGHVVDGRNNPVPWADVFVNAPNQPGHHVRADAGGAFSVEELAPGKALVSVLSRMVRTRQTVESGETNVVIMLGEEQAPEIVAPPPATTPAPVAEPHPLGAPWQPWKL